RRMLKRSGLIFACSMVLFLVVGLSTVHAAEQLKTPPQASETKPAPPVAIPDSEIIPRAEQALKAFQKIRSEVAADSTSISISKEFPSLVEKSDRRRESDAETMARVRSMQRVNEILREWSLEQDQLNDWDRALAERSKLLTARGKDIDQIIETWRATQAQVAKKFLLKAVLQRRVEEVLREAQATRQVVEQQTTTLLKMQGQIADRLAALAQIREEIDQVREGLGQSLIKLDSPPLWRALFGAEAQDAIEAFPPDTAQRIIDDLQAFAQKYIRRIPLHLVLFLIVLGLFYLLRRNVTPEATVAMEPSVATVVLNRPVASSFLLALVASPMLYPDASAGILRSAIVATVIPLGRLLPGLLPQKYQRRVLLWVGLYALDFLRYQLPQDWLLSRLLLLTIATVGLIALILSLHSRNSELSTPRFSERLGVLAAGILAFLFALSVVSNVVGNLSLAEVLVGAPLRITYITALIFAAAHLLTAIVALTLQLPAARLLCSVRKHSAFLASRCRTLIRLAAIVVWLLVVLNMTRVLGDVAASLGAFFQLHWKLGAAEISIRGLAAFFGVLFTAILVSRLIRFVLTEEILPRIRLPRGVPGAVDVLSRYGIMLLGFFIALAAAGVDFSKVTLLVSALGVGIGFGLQTVVNNFVSGLILVFEHPVQVGDAVEVGTPFGEVRKIGFRASVLRTPDGADVIIPNSELTGSRVINWSLFDRLRRISVSVGAAYGTDPSRVIDILMDIARKHSSVLTYPAPMAVFDRFADSSLSFTLLCWVNVDRFFLTRSELTIAVNNAFKEAGIQIPFPQQDVHVHWPEAETFGRRVPASSESTERKAPPGSVLPAAGSIAAKEK
ncbi:MAG TPA: mechanosensitive ion channel domain-containing protein, partial [Candidatus Limnocylindria bacterium]|nr:mechanosensitive ion channel domain-containing protein [Candidatus Limnocylindria bacterium]